MEEVANDWITRVDRLWLLRPFQKALERRQRERHLGEQLNECVGLLFRDPRHRGLNLETIDRIKGMPVLSARITGAYRLILVALARAEVGLLYFDNHQEAYRWVKQHRAEIPTMLERVQEIPRTSSGATRFELVPAVRADEDAPLAIAEATQFAQLLDEGLSRYLTYLDDDQRRLVDLQVSGLLLIKGSAGTGKTAVAIHRLLALARQPVLVGASKVLYLCFNRLLAQTVRLLIASLGGGDVPPEIEVKTFHGWCGEFLRTRPNLPRANEEECRQQVYRAFGELAPEERTTLKPLDGRFVNEEIVEVIVHNGLETFDDYLRFNRRGRPERLKQASRAAIWRCYEIARAHMATAGICYYGDLPRFALRALTEGDERPVYRAIVIDEGQDCSPVMIRLARQLLEQPGGQLTVLADPGQAMFRNGFQWTQHELDVKGGNVRWLRKTYRTTREIYTLARPLVADQEDLKPDLEQTHAPERSGPRPLVVVTADAAERRALLAEWIVREVSQRPPGHLGILAATRATLDDLGGELERRGVPTRLLSGQSDSSGVLADAVKLLTIQSAKGLDFPVCVVVAPHVGDLGGPDLAHRPETRRALYVALTRASEKLVVGLVDRSYHPLIEQLDLTSCEFAGSRGRPFANLLGISPEDFLGLVP